MFSNPIKHDRAIRYRSSWVCMRDRSEAVYIGWHGWGFLPGFYWHVKSEKVRSDRMKYLVDRVSIVWRSSLVGYTSFYLICTRSSLLLLEHYTITSRSPRLLFDLLSRITKLLPDCNKTTHDRFPIVTRPCKSSRENIIKRRKIIVGDLNQECLKILF